MKSINLALVLAAVVSINCSSAPAQVERSLEDNAKTPLQGRIEQIGAPDAKLPIELSANADSHLEANIAGFTGDMMGGWGGELTTTYYTHSRGYDDPYRKTGTTCKVVFYFKESNGKVTLKPPPLIFPRENRVIDAERLASDAGTNRWSWEVPTVTLGNSDWVYGATMRDAEHERVIHNTITMLEPGVVEQDLVTEIAIPHKKTRYSEVVLRFERVSRESLRAQVAKIDYKNNREPFRKWLWQGTLSQNWHEVAEEIAGNFKMALSDYESKYPDHATWLGEK